MAEAAPALLYLPGLPAAGARVELAGAEAHYVARVCRARAGERLEATDGNGARATLRLLEVRGAVAAEVEAVTRETPVRPAWVLCGAPEGERADWLVEKLAELGVARFQPVDTSRGSLAAGGGTARALGAAGGGGPAPVAAHPPDDGRRSAAAGAGPGGPARRAAGAGSPTSRGSGSPTGWSVEGSPAVGLVGPASGLDDGERAAALRRGLRPDPALRRPAQDGDGSPGVGCLVERGAGLRDAVAFEAVARLRLERPWFGSGLEARGDPAARGRGPTPESAVGRLGSASPGPESRPHP